MIIVEYFTQLTYGHPIFKAPFFTNLRSFLPLTGGFGRMTLDCTGVISTVNWRVWTSSFTSKLSGGREFLIIPVQVNLSPVQSLKSCFGFNLFFFTVVSCSSLRKMKMGHEIEKNKRREKKEENKKIKGN